MEQARPRVLFILKFREHAWGGYSNPPGKGMSSGLLNSARFVHDMLVHAGVESRLVQVEDNNKIDREVTSYRPTHVIVEALWVVSSKFQILTKLHPKVKWIIRNHSDLPFLSNEGIAIEWLLDYVTYPNVMISNNSPAVQEEMEFLVRTSTGWDAEAVREKVVYLPNYYPIDECHPDEDHPDEDHPPEMRKHPESLDVGCFGAIRPLKNQLIQAVSAMRYADWAGKKLRFHINATRVEGRGDPILKNIRELFKRCHPHQLVEHGWMSHEKFLRLVGHMDLMMQVSFSETFNIVAADAVCRRIPMVGSDEIPWLCPLFAADPNDGEDIIWAIKKAFLFKRLLPVDLNRWLLGRYVAETRRIWLRYFHHHG